MAARVVLHAALSLDGSWRTGALDAAGGALLRGGARSALWTDLPALARRAGFSWASRAALRARALEEKGALRIAGSPALHAALLAADAVGALVLLWGPELVLGVRRETLAAPFAPSGGERLRFRLQSARATPRGLLCRYRAA